jgi:uncharacterized protein YbjT (DUF2867 family)
MPNKKAILIGASGLVGSHILNELISNKNYSEIEIFVRKKLPLTHPKLIQTVIDFEKLGDYDFICNDVFCAIGTTINKAGSKEAQLHIDYEIPYLLGKMTFFKGAKGFYLISSLGANPISNNFYLNTKGLLEQNIAKIGFETFVSMRPSMLLGDRQESRIGESIGKVLVKILNPFMFGSLKKYAGIEATIVAKATVNLANKGIKGIQYVESDAIKTFALEN